MLRVLSGVLIAIAASLAQAQYPNPRLGGEFVHVAEQIARSRLTRIVRPVAPAERERFSCDSKVYLILRLDDAGAPAQINVISGEPVLAASAVQAVRQWRFEPYFIDGKPVRVQTQVTLVCPYDWDFPAG
ncbi:MAG TPA: energy transducer TonB [Clostridia bacterium]|nr:energy transducer TonB [Clostridia bacterium]